MLENLTLAQEYILVVTSTPQSNKIRYSRSYSQIYTIGAAFIELILERQLLLNEQGKLELTGESSGDDGKQPLLEIIRGAARPKTMKNWISFFLNRPGKRNAVFNALVQPLFRNELIHQEEYKVFFFFSANRYIANAKGKDRVVQSLRAELLEEGPVPLETSALVMLLEASNQLKHYFSEYERNGMQLKLKRLQTEQNAEWKVIVQIKKAIQEMEAAGAVAGATTAATSAATSGS